jgi:concentrative nucleoside transporter, CNT family
MPTPASGTPRLARVFILACVVALASLAWLIRDTIGVRGQAVFGIACFLGVAFGCSTNIWAVRRRTVITGFLLQIFLALMILRVEPVRQAFEWMGSVAKQFLSFSSRGGEFVFGPLVNIAAIKNGLHVEDGVVFAFIVLPTVVFVSSVFTVLYHLGILQLVVRGFAKVMRWVMGTSGAETLSVTANVFLGQTEAPLIVKPFISRMTRSELLALMIGGMAHISGALMAVYIGMGADPVAILATSVMAAPASLYICKILIPETEHPETLGDVKPSGEKEHANVIDAAAAGASQGMQLAINIAAMLIAFLAFIAMFNFILGKIGTQIDFPDLSLEWIFSKLFSPIAFLTGVTPEDCPRFGELLGKKLVANEFVAFQDMSKKNVLMEEIVSVDALGVESRTFRFAGVQGIELRTYRLACFALTGFANFASIGIQLGGIGAMAPGRRSDLARLGLRALLGGFLATLINASIAGILMG